MRSRYLYAALCLALGLSMGACGTKEPETPATSTTTAPAATPIDPATAATVSGTVVFEGTPPKAKAINMAAEPSCAKEHSGKPVMTEEVVTGDGGALANVLVYVKQGLENRNFPAPSEPVVIDQKGCMYSPHVVALQVNQKLEVRNDDQTTHNIHPTPTYNREWNKSQPAGAAPLEESFSREEVAIPVKCNVHPWMRSYIAVLKNPYYFITQKDGKFELKNLPPGEYTIEAWQEKLGTATEKVTLGPKEAKTITFKFSAPAGD